MEHKLSKAAYRWRNILSNDSDMTGAFHGMRAIVHTSKERHAAFSRLILSGGGEVDNSIKLVI